MKIHSFPLLAAGLWFQLESTVVLADIAEPDCPCWSKEQLDQVNFPDGKSCRVTGYFTYVGDTPYWSNDGNTLHFSTGIPLASGPPGCQVKNATWPVGRLNKRISPAEFDVCSKQVVEKCGYCNREKNPLVSCPCWPLGLNGPSPPVTYQKCQIDLYPTYEKFENIYPCGDRIPEYDFACGGGILTNEASNPRCRVADESAVWMSITEQEYQACRTEILDACDEWAEEQYDASPKGGCMGDPHFKRFHHEKRDSFHGECDLVLLSSARAELDIHIRTTLATYYSFIEQVALRLGPDVLEFHATKVFVNGRQFELVHSSPVTVGSSGAQLYKLENGETTSTIEKSHRYKIDWKNGLSIVVKATKNFMAVSLDGDTHDLTDAVGMLGDYHTGDMHDRRGNIMQGFGDFGMEWQVMPDQDSHLFLEDREPQLPYERCRLPSMDRGSGAVASRRLRERQANPELEASAIEVCTSLHPQDFELCVEDVVMTGDIDMAYAW